MSRLELDFCNAGTRGCCPGVIERNCDKFDGFDE